MNGAEPPGRFQPHPIPDAGTPPRQISALAAVSYLTCSLRFHLERVPWDGKNASKRLHLAKAVHAALRAFHFARFHGGDHSPGALARVFEKAFVRMEDEEGPVDFEDGADRDAFRKCGLRMIGAFLDSREASLEIPASVGVRMTEEIPGLSVPLTGVVDLIDAAGNLVDFHCVEAKPGREEAKFGHEIQLVSNQLLVESATGRRPTSLDLVFLVLTKDPQVIRMKFPPADQHRRRRVTALLEIAVVGITAGRFHPQPGIQCGVCRFRQECGAWEPHTYKQGRAA
jgi:putative RecB family exonuclease